MRLVNWRTLVVATAGLGLAACGDDVSITPPNLVVTANPTAVSCVAGTQSAVGVSVTGGSTTPTVAFSGGSATVATVTGTGTSATISCVGAGATAITYTITSGSQVVTGSIPVTVTAPSGVTSLTVTPATFSLTVGAVQRVTPTLTTSGSTVSTAVTWASADPSIATVDANGNVTGVKVGTTAITATSVASPGVRATAQVNVLPASALVQSIVASPSAVTLQTGGTQQITSNVTLSATAPAGTSTGVTYQTSAPGVATVSNAGVITAVGNGTATITVASVAAPTVTQQITVTVRDPAPIRLTIQGTRFTNLAGNLVPVDPSNVGGPITVTLNLDPGDFRPDSVRLRLGSAVVTCQRFSAQLAEAYRLAVTTGSADVQSIECPLNTSAFNATTGAVNVTNGPQTLTAEVFYRPSGTASASTTQQASITQQLTINNQSGFFVSVANAPSASQAAFNAAGQATGPQGVLWRAGTVNVTVLPVNFTPLTNPGTQSFTVTLQDANGIVAQRTATGAAAATSFSASFAGAPASVFNANGDPVTTVALDGYTSPNAGAAPAFNPGGAYVGGGTVVVIGTQAGTGNTSVLNAAGQPAGFGGGFGNTLAQPIFIDNQTPQPAVNFGLNGGVLGPPNSNFSATGTQYVGFINGAFNFQNSLTPQFFTAANNAAAPLTANNPDFGGVDRVTVQFFAGPSTNPATLTSGTAIASGQAVPPSTTNTANNLAVLMTDALGNARAQRVGTGAGGANLTINASGTTVSGNQFVSFGVDITAPTIGQTAGPTANAIVNDPTVATTLQFAGSDETGFGVNPILITASRTARITSTTANVGDQGDVGSASSATASAPATYCAISVTAGGVLQFADASGGTCAPIATQGGVTVPAGLNGQYSINATARDQAGNQSSSVSRIVLVDTKAPVIGGIGVPQSISGNTSVVFPTSATDNLEIGSSRGEVDYAAVLSFSYPSTTVGTAFDNVFTASINPLNVTIPQFIRSITQAPGAIVQSTRTVASNVRAVVLDVASNTAFSNVAIPAANIGNLSGTSPFKNAVTPTTPVNQLDRFYTSITVGNAPPNLVGVISGGATAGQPTSATFTVYQNGAQNTFISPIQRLELYVQVPALAGAPATYRFIGTVPAGLVTDNVGGNGVRVIQSTFTLTATTSPLITAPNAGINNYSIIAVGVNSTGDAIVSDPLVLQVIP